MILLNTHVFLWWLFGGTKLPKNMVKIIEDRDYEIFISAASVWGIVTKYRLGKLPEAEHVAKHVPSWIDQAGFTSLAISVEHAQLAGSWNVDHRDSFDRMLAAQAKLENMPLATVDKKLPLFPIEIVFGR